MMGILGAEMRDGGKRFRAGAGFDCVGPRVGKWRCIKMWLTGKKAMRIEIDFNYGLRRVCDLRSPWPT